MSKTMFSYNNQSYPVTLSSNKYDLHNNYKVVEESEEFTFIGLCPYCGGDLIFVAYGWVKDDKDLWMAESFDIECSNKPDGHDSKKWDRFLKTHHDYPYIMMLSIEEAVKEWINERYRFELI